MSRLVLSQITIKKERSISSTTWYYLLQPSNASAPDSTNYGNPPPIYSDTGYSGWSTTEPTYTVGDDRVLYTMVQTLYSDNTFSYSTPTISSSYEAAKDAYNEVVQAEQDILELQEFGLANGYIWDNMTYVAPTSTIPVYPIGSYIASGMLVNGSRTITLNNSNTYGLNTWISTGGINLRYNAIDLMKLTTSNLEFYYPSTSSQGTKAISLGTNGAINSLVFYGFNNSNKTMELTNNALKFYDPSDGITEQAKLDTNGLVLSKGGIKAGDPNQSGFIYLSTEDYPLREFILTEDQAIDNNKTYYQFDSNSQTYIDVEEPDISEINTYYELTEAGIPINNYTPTKGDNNLGTISSPAWRQVIGTKFGVDSEGNLYASGANINGAITATSLTIQSNGNNYDGMAAINISGYDITIEIYNAENESDPDNYTYLIPHMYHNGENIDNTITDKTDFIWYRDDSSIGTAGAVVDGGIRAYRGSTYRVIYEFEDGAVGDSTTIQDRYLYPTEYITDITDAGIKVHPKEWLTDSNYLQIDGNGIYVKNSNDIELAHFTGTNAQIGKTSSNNVFIDENSLNIRKGVDILASFTNTSVQVGKTSLSNIFIDENSLDIRKGADTFATFSTTGVQIGKNSGMHSKMTASSMTFYGVQNEPIALLAYIPSPTLDKGSAFYTFGTRPSGCLVGTWSFAEGENVIASGVDSHAEGCNTQATGHYSHAEGCDTQANGLYSHAQNNGTIASKTSQTVIGKFNQEDTESISAKTKAFIIGNGANENNRSNAFTIDFSGNVVASGEIMDGNGNTISKAYCYVNSVTSTTITTASTNTQVPITSINSTNSFTYDSTTNGIKCNKSGRYLVSCGLYASTATSGDLMGVSVTKNDGASTCGPQYQRAGGNNETIMLMPTPIQLAEGDILTILGRNNTSARGTFTSCRFSVWEI